MINGRLHTEMKYRGKKMIIDACQLESGWYEVMAMYDGGAEIESVKVNDLDDAEKEFNGLRFKYQDQEFKALSGKYAKLRDDLIKVVEIAQSLDYGEDGGTCNFDAPSIAGEGWREAMVKQAAKEAGISVFKWKLYGGARWVFGVPGGGQAKRRSRKAEAMTKALADMGYDAVEYCSMD